MQPIPKPKKDASMSDKYRSIALAPTLSKVFEWCILIKFHGAFATSSLQFGFKPGVSTDLCTGLIKNVTARYCYNRSPVYGCFLDASKAFDRVDHGLLFKKLLQGDLHPTVVRTLLTLSGRENLLKISRVGVASAKSRSLYLRPLIRSGGGRRVPWRRQCGRYPWVSPTLYGSGFSIAVGVVLTTTFTAADRSQKASRNDIL